MTRNIEYKMVKTAFHPTSGKALYNDVTRKSDLYRLDVDRENEIALKKHIEENKISGEELDKLFFDRIKRIQENKE